MPKKNTKVLPPINWKIKFKKYYRDPSGCNVTVTVTDGAKSLAAGRKILTIIIRDNLWKQFDSNYVAFGVFKNRLYFNKSDKFDGYSIVAKNTTAYIKCTIVNDDITTYKQFVGSHTLKYDEYYELYYIEFEGDLPDGN